MLLARNPADASPSESVTRIGVWTEPCPDVMAHRTGTPAIGCPDALTARTTMRAVDVNCSLTSWPLPDTSWSCWENKEVVRRSNAEQRLSFIQENTSRMGRTAASLSPCGG